MYGMRVYVCHTCACTKVVHAMRVCIMVHVSLACVCIMVHNMYAIIWHVHVHGYNNYVHRLNAVRINH